VNMRWAYWRARASIRNACRWLYLLPMLLHVISWDEFEACLSTLDKADYAEMDNWCAAYLAAKGFK
jgi:hypothetical protein